MSIYTAFEKVAELLSQVESSKLESLQAPASLQSRFETLIAKSKVGKITPAEKDELDHFIVLERLVRSAKIRARARRVQRA
jgi:hypothetical protein